MKKKVYYYKGKRVILRDGLVLGEIVKVLPNKYFLVSFYENNKFKYSIIEEYDIVDEEEYQVIRKRVNFINSILY